MASFQKRQLLLGLAAIVIIFALLNSMDSGPERTLEEPRFPPVSFASAAASCNTDKQVVHHYEYMYESVVAEMLRLRRQRNPNLAANPRLRVLEIGFAGGGGFCILNRWLPGIEYTALEFNRDLISKSRIQTLTYLTQAERDYLVDHVRFVDQCSESNWTALVPQLPEYDIIIDDACHAAHCQLFTLKHLWSRLKPGGIFIIEDTAFSSTHMFRTEYTIDGLESWHFMGNITRDMQLAALERYHVKNEYWRKWLVPKERLEDLRARSLPFAMQIQRFQCDPEICAVFKMFPGTYTLPEKWPSNGGNRNRSAGVVAPVNRGKLTTSCSVTERL